MEHHPQGEGGLAEEEGGEAGEVVAQEAGPARVGDPSRGVPLQEAGGVEARVGQAVHGEPRQEEEGQAHVPHPRHVAPEVEDVEEEVGEGHHGDEEGGPEPHEGGGGVPGGVVDHLHEEQGGDAHGDAQARGLHREAHGHPGEPPPVLLGAAEAVEAQEKAPHGGGHEEDVEDVGHHQEHLQDCRVNGGPQGVPHGEKGFRAHRLPPSA